MNNKKAKEMFEELGFKKQRTKNGNTVYEKGGFTVCFYIEESFYYTRFGWSFEKISPELHKAIHQQLVELGWV